MQFVLVSWPIFAASSLCYSAVRLSMTKCTSLFLYNDCLCVKPMRLLINFAPQLLTDPHRSYWRNIGLIKTISEYGIWPSTKQSHPRLSISIEICKKLEVGCVQSTLSHCPWLTRYALIILANSETIFALSRTSMMVWFNCGDGVLDPGLCIVYNVLNSHVCIHIEGIDLWCFLPRVKALSCSAPSRNLLGVEFVEHFGVAGDSLIVSNPLYWIKMCK